MNAGSNGLDQGADADGEVGGTSAPALPGWSVNRLARELRLDRRTIHKRIMLHNVPAIAEGPKGALYDLADAARAIFGQATLSEVEGLNRRILQAKAEAAELDLAAKRGEMVNAADVRKAAAANARMERAALVNWPDRAAPALAAELGVDQAHLTAAIEREVRAFMEDRAKDDGRASL